MMMIIVKNALIDPVTLTFQSPNHVTSRITRGLFYTNFEHFGIICFWVILQQTNKQTDCPERHTHADPLQNPDLWIDCKKMSVFLMSVGCLIDWLID